MTRLPTPAFEEKVYTPQEDELRRIRHSLSRAAARLGMKGVSLAQTIGEVEAQLDTLRGLSAKEARE